jgi:hypothetical protein
MTNADEHGSRALNLVQNAFVGHVHLSLIEAKLAMRTLASRKRSRKPLWAPSEMR